MNEYQNNNTVRGLIALIVIAGLGAVGYVGYQYYQGRYVGSTYYAQVPADASITVDDLLDADGKPADSGHEYVLTGDNEEGQTATLEFAVHAEDPADLYQPGTYIKAGVSSSSLVVRQQAITESEVPTAVMKHLQK